MAVVAASPRRVAFGSFVLLALALTEGIGLLLLVPLLQLVGVETTHGSLDGIATQIRGVFSWAGVQPTLAVVLVLYIAIVSFQTALGRAHALLSTAVQHDTSLILRIRTAQHLAQMQWLFFVRRRQSDFVHVLTGEIERVGAAAYCLVELVVALVMLLVYVGLALSVSAEITILVLLFGGVLALAVRSRLRDSQEYGEQAFRLRKQLYATVADQLGAMKTAKTYNTEVWQSEIFRKLSQELGHVTVKMVGDYATLRQQTQLGTAVVLALTVYATREVLALPTAQLLLLLFLFARLMPRVTNLFERAQTFATVLPAFDAVDQLQRSCAAAAEPVVDRHREITFTREIRFKDVTFQYPLAGELAGVRDLNLLIPARTVTAVVGPSGAGKSTVADLLLGLLSPAKGSILVDGQPLCHDQLRSWRNGIGYVAQDTFLHHDSVRANLVWARRDASDTDLWHALELAAADEFVRRLPGQLDAVVGDRGVLLSGGERQRLSLARALLRRPKLLVLDEATNSLDTENEARIYRALERLRHEMTIVVIAHRLSLVRIADIIHVIEAGQVVESGPWAELAERPGGRLMDLYLLQGSEDVASSRGASESPTVWQTTR